MEFPQEIQDYIRDLHGTAKAETKRIMAEAAQAAQTEKLWADFERFIVKGWVLHVIALAACRDTLLGFGISAGVI